MCGHRARLLEAAHVNDVLPSGGVMECEVVVGPRVQRTTPEGVRPACCCRRCCARSSRPDLRKKLYLLLLFIGAAECSSYALVTFAFCFVCFPLFLYHIAFALTYYLSYQFLSWSLARHFCFLSLFHFLSCSLLLPHFVSSPLRSLTLPTLSPFLPFSLSPWFSLIPRLLVYNVYFFFLSLALSWNSSRLFFLFLCFSYFLWQFHQFPSFFLSHMRSHSIFLSILCFFGFGLYALKPVHSISRSLFYVSLSLSVSSLKLQHFPFLPSPVHNYQLFPLFTTDAGYFCKYTKK